MSGFSNPIAAVRQLIRSALESSNFVTGVSGWRISRDGTAEFQDLSARLNAILGNPTGRRIILDGVNGLIQVVDANDLLRIQLGNTDPIASGQLKLFSGDSEEIDGGILSASSLGAVGGKQMASALLSPQTGSSQGQQASIELFSDATDDHELSQIFYNAHQHNFDDYDGSFSADLLLNGRSQPRGILHVERSASTGPTNITAETIDGTIADVTFTAESGRRYRLAFTAKLGLDVASNTLAGIRIRDGGGSTPTTLSTLLFEASTPLALAGGAGQATVSFERYLDCPADIAAGAHTLRPFALRLAGATATVSLVGSASSPKHLAIEDVGPNTNA